MWLHYNKTMVHFVRGKSVYIDRSIAISSVSSLWKQLKWETEKEWLAFNRLTAPVMSLLFKVMSVPTWSDLRTHLPHSQSKHLSHLSVFTYTHANTGTLPMCPHTSRCLAHHILQTKVKHNGQNLPLIQSKVIKVDTVVSLTQSEWFRYEEIPALNRKLS